jgi:hypothetical protein
MKTKTNPDEIVKCACGLPMRQKKWSDHWRTCRFGSSVPVTEEDVENLKRSETKMKESYGIES